MKNKALAIICLFLLMLSTTGAQGEVITATSDPFIYGSPTPIVSTPVPISSIAVVFAVVLIGLYAFRQRIGLVKT